MKFLLPFLFFGLFASVAANAQHTYSPINVGPSGQVEKSNGTFELQPALSSDIVTLFSNISSCTSSLPLIGTGGCGEIPWTSILNSSTITNSTQPYPLVSNNTTAPTFQPLPLGSLATGNLPGGINFGAIYPVVQPVTSATIAAAESAACANGGGVVLFPQVTVTAASGALTGPLPICTTASVYYSGSGYAVQGAGSAAIVSGTHLIGNGTFDLWDFNNIDCGGGTCTEPTSAAPFLAGMLIGGGVMNMTIDGFQYGIKCGALYEPGCSNSFFYNLNLINNTLWGIWSENFWKGTVFQNIISNANTKGGQAYLSSGGSANQNGNSFAYNLSNDTSSNVASRGILIGARGINGQLNNFIVDGLLSIAEGHTALAVTATMMYNANTATLTNGSATIALASNTFVTGQRVIPSTTVGTGANGIVSGTIYYATNAFGTSMGVATTYANAIAGTAISFNASGTTTFSSSDIEIAGADITDFPVDQEVTLTGTVTNTGYTLLRTYLVTYNDGNRFISLSQYMGGNPIAAPTGAVSGLSVKTFGASPLQLVGYVVPGSTSAVVLGGAIHGLDLETNGGTANCAAFIQSTRDNELQPAGFITQGSTATYCTRSNNGVILHPIADAAQNFDIDPNDFVAPLMFGVSSSASPYNGGSNLLPIGIAQLNGDNTDTRCATGQLMVFLTGVATVDLCPNKNADFLDFRNFAIGAMTSQISGTTTIAPGQWTSNALYTGSGGDTWTLYCVPSNGDGEEHDITNPSSGTLTLSIPGGCSQVFNGLSGQLTFSIPANSLAHLRSTNAAGTYGWSISVPEAGTGLTSIGLSDLSTTPLYNVSNTPLTANGTLGITLKTQAANCVIAGPASGSAVQPTCRALVAADIPSGYVQPTGTTTNGDIVSFANSAGTQVTNAPVQIGTSGNALAELSGANTWGAAQSFGTGNLFNQLSFSGSISVAGGVANGMGMLGSATPTYTDSSGTGGTIGNAYLYAFPVANLAASTATTYSRVAELYVPAPTCGTNATCSALYSLLTAGNVEFLAGMTSVGTATLNGGNILINSNSNHTVGIGTGTTTSTVSIGGGANDIVLDATSGGLSVSGGLATGTPGNDYICISTGGVLSEDNLPCVTGVASQLSVPGGTPTYTPGAGVTSVVCATGYLCSNTRGTLTVVGGTATTGTIITVNYSANLSSQAMCFAKMNGGATAFDIGTGALVSPFSGFPITASVSIIGATFNVDYWCMP
jgi:hypothetical protein